MALIVDKHRPRSLDQLTYHDDLSDRLRSLVGRLDSFFLLYTVHTQFIFILFNIHYSYTINTNSSTRIGTIRRLPPSPPLRTIRRRQKNPHRMHPQRTLRPLSRENKNRFPCLPTLILIPKTRIQYRILSISSRNHPFRCRKL